MAINPNNGVLDIINGTLKVSSIDIKQAGGFSTAINTVARNDVLLFDDQKSTTTFTPTTQGGYMSSTGVTRDTSSNYLELGTASDAGWVYWPLQLPNSWHTEFDMHVTATGGVLTFSLFNTSEPNHTDYTNNDGGYKIVFDNTNNQIVVYWEGSVHKTVSATLRSNDWQSVNINYFQGAISVSLAGKVVLTHEFTENYQEFDSRYIGFSATAGTSHKIRHLRVHNSDKWLYTKTSNASDISYVSGNVGIGSLSPTELLDVHGNVHIAKNLTVDGNLTVSGTTTFIDSTNLAVEDPIIELAKGNAVDTIDSGLIVTRNTSNVAIAFRGDEEELALGYTQSGASSTDVTPIANGGLDVRVYGNLFANNLTTTANVEATYLKGDGSEITQVTLDQVVGYANTTANTIQLTNSDVGLKVTGNVEANYFVGDGSKLTGLVTDLQSVADNGNTSSNTIQFTNATTAFIANSNVGIGTDAPTANLHVMGYQYVNGPPTLTNAFDHTDAPLTLTHGTATSDTAINDPKPLLHLTRDGTTSQSYGARASFNLSRYENSSTHSRSRLDVALADGTYAESTVMTLRADGKVGVGTVTPAYTLDVHGSANVGALTATTISGPVSGNASTATALATARAIGGVSFDGTANIDLPGVNTSGTQDTSGNAATATTATNQSGGTVNATTIAGQSISLADNIVHTGDTSTSFGFPGTGTIDFFTGGYERMRIASSGKVGIGTTGPSGTLDIESSSAGQTAVLPPTTQLVLSCDDANAGDPGDLGAGLTFKQRWYNGNATRTATGGIYGVKTNSNGSYGGGMAFFRGPAGGTNLTEAMRIDHSGNVGIGTTSPLQPLHVKSNGQNPVIYMTEANNNRYASGMGSQHVSNEGQRLDFYNGDSGANGTSLSSSHIRMSIDAYGNVGIGTTSPGSLLSIESTTGNQMRLNYNADWYNVIERDSSGNLNFLEKRGASASLANLMTIETEGNVGIGTNDPHGQLHIGPKDNNHIYLASSNNRYGWKLDTDDQQSGDVPFRIIKRTDGTDTTVLTIKNQNGDVGIGGIVAESKLHIYATDNLLMFQSQRSPYPKMSFDWSGSNAENFTLWDHHSNQRAYLYGRKYTTGTNANSYAGWYFYGNDNTVGLRINGSGNVGIGDTSPSYKLSVNGTFRVHGNVATFGSDGLVHINSRSSQYGSETVALQTTIDGRALSESSPGTYGGEQRNVLSLQPDGGRVGIGITGPASKLHVQHGTGDNVTDFRVNSGGYLRLERNHNNSPWIQTTMSSGHSGIHLGTGSNDWLIRKYYANLDFDYNGSTKGYLLHNSTVNQIDFTGQHRSFIDDVLHTEYDSHEGLIVSANKNKYFDIDEDLTTGANAIQISQSIPLVSISTKEKDKACFGVISGSEDPDSRKYEQGTFVTVVEKQVGDRRAFINSVGEGAIWVTNINGNLESGDYITTSNVAGYGMLQDDDILHNYTVAKITMDCDFAPATQPVQIIKKELGNVNYWVETTYSNVALEEYSNLTEENRQTVTTTEYSNEEGEISPGEYSNLESNVQATYSEIETVTYQKIERKESKTEQEGYTLEVREELVNVLDEHGQLQWEDHPTDTEKAYKIRYLTSDGTRTDEANAVHIAAFVGCTYHCG